jgi:hypothetical protein
MSRSRKKNIIKDRPRNQKKSAIYWRTVRRVQNQKVKSLVLDPENVQIPEPKIIVNDYTRCDYIIDFRFSSDKDKKKKFSRK